MINSPLISIVVPIYNREQTISTCIESVLNNKFENYELILIDDGSSDLSLKICKNYQTSDTRIHVISQTNGGVSKARNEGIKVAKGSYITFLDSDDAYSIDHLQILSSIDTENAELLVTGFTSAKIVSGKIEPMIRQTQLCNKKIIGNSNIIKFIYQDNNPYQISYFTIWNKIFRMDILRQNNIRFDETVSLGEDQIFVINYLPHVNTLIWNTEQTYFQIAWDSKPPGLGTMQRSADDFLYNQQANYNALLALFKKTNNQSVRDYATNYIIDRVITRIIFRTVWQNKISSFFNKEFANTIKKVRSVVLMEKENFYKLSDKTIQRVAYHLINYSNTRSLLFVLYTNGKYKVSAKIKPLIRFLMLKSHDKKLSK